MVTTNNLRALKHCHAFLDGCSQFSLCCTPLRCARLPLAERCYHSDLEGQILVQEVLTPLWAPAS